MIAKELLEIINLAEKYKGSGYRKNGIHFVDASSNLTNINIKLNKLIFEYRSFFWSFSLDAFKNILEKHPYYKIEPSILAVQCRASLCFITDEEHLRNCSYYRREDWGNLISVNGEILWENQYVM